MNCFIPDVCIDNNAKVIKTKVCCFIVVLCVSNLEEKPLVKSMARLSGLVILMSIDYPCNSTNQTDTTMYNFPLTYYMITSAINNLRVLTVESM